MIKKELMALRTLKATPKMMEMARNDQKIPRQYKSWGRTYTATVYEYSIFMRCQTLKGYLKVALFLPEMMRCGSDLPVYELFIHKKAGQFLTWDCREQRWREAMIDNLDWPSNYYRSKIWIDPEGGQTVKSYLGVSESGWDGILAYQRRIRAENVEKRYKRQTDPWDAELAQTPELPKDWKTWCAKYAVEEHWIFYDYEMNTQMEGLCTYCGHTVKLTNPRHNKREVCPHCGTAVQLKNRKRLKYLHTKPYYAYLIQRTKKGFVVREFRVTRGCWADEGWRQNVHDHEIRRAFYDGNGKPVSAYRWDLFANREHRFIYTDVCGMGWNNGDKGKIYPRTLPSLAKKELRFTGLPEYVKQGSKVDAEWYMTVWNRHPELEQLAKADLKQMVADCLNNTSLLNAIWRRGKGNLAKRLGLDEQGLKRLRRMGGGVVCLNWLQWEKRRGIRLEDAVISYFMGHGVGPDSLSFISDRMTPVQIRNYIEKQLLLMGESYSQTVTTWRDYLNMAKKDGRDLDDPYFYKPARLKQHHDELVLKAMMKDLQKAADKTEKEYPKVRPVLESIRDIYGYVGDTYSVIVPEGVLDIMVEGKALNHCVGTSTRYLERMERRESYILFLRKTAAPQQSYYTLEVEPDGTVRQKRTTNDEQRPDIKEATAFLKEWQKEVAKRLTAAELELAKQSKKLRLEGFEQMKKDRVQIHTGKLQGRMLVDVLMADLMENTNKEEQTA